ncbi:MAG: hypothetical protein Q8K38_07595 [Burkholderiaceae bacterium]|nr:hypothetical protein [Burkholderiaceae bacterium]MDZ4146611.1 hypothetical protein [Burkholderiales bacterium]
MTSSEDNPARRYALRFVPEALAEWHALDGSVRVPLKKLLAKRLDQTLIASVLHKYVTGRLAER